jgi:thymidine kinase
MSNIINSSISNPVGLDSEGYLYLIIGPMFAGKSSTLIRLIRKFKSKQIPILILKHSFDTRYDGLNNICSHDKITEPCQNTDNLLKYINSDEYKKAQVIVVEEAQFFEKDLIEFCKQAVDHDNKYVIVTGLSGDYKRKPFGQILNLIPLANQVELLEAYCYFCKGCIPAHFTTKISGTNETIEVGIGDIYKPVCRKHYNKNIKSSLELI